MEYRQLGRTGLRVSEVGFGGAPAGLRNYLGAWEPESAEADERIAAAIRHAIDRGINYFDTAPGYGGGRGEELFGHGLRGRRDRVVIATKVTGASADAVRRSVEQSLRHLGTDTIDLLQYHGGWYTQEQLDGILRPGGALAGMQAARDEGLVRHIGFTTEGTNGAASALIATDAFDVMQICYNLIFQHPYDPSRQAGLIYEAAARNMGIVTMRSLTSGTFQRWLGMVAPEVAGVIDWHRALLSFVLSNPHLSVAIVGMRSPEEVDANIAAAANHSMRVDLDALHTRYV